jgi:hypothetical protein
MEIKNYSLSDIPDSNDKISVNISRRRHKIYQNMRSFFNQKINNGVWAENILRLVLDGVNLNQLSKNHPHVDIAIINEIPGIAQKNEIISCKSSNKRTKIKNGKLSRVTLASIIRDTKSITLESIMSYIIFADSDFELDFTQEFLVAKSLLKNESKVFKEYKNRDWKAFINTLMYYCMFQNTEEGLENFKSDIRKIGESRNVQNYNLHYGTFNNYRLSVLRRLVNLDAPISLGLVNLSEENGITFQIRKTYPIKLNRYWERLVKIWIDEDFFDYNTKKYLNKDLVENLFEIDEDEFPILLNISIGDWLPEEDNTSNMTTAQKTQAAKEKAQKKTNKLYVATKFRDSYFGEKEEEVDDFFIKSIDALEENPNLITKFSNFITSLKNPSKLDKWWSY